MVGGAPIGLVAEMWAAATRQEPQPGDDGQAISPRVGERLLEPADRARAQSGDDRPRFPRLSYQGLEIPLAPHAEHRLGVPTTDEEDVLLLDERCGLAYAPEQLQMRRATRQGGEGLVEPDDVVVGVRARGGEKAVSRAFGGALTEDVVKESRPAGLRNSAHRDDLSIAFHQPSSRRPSAQRMAAKPAARDATTIRVDLA